MDADEFLKKRSRKIFGLKIPGREKPVIANETGQVREGADTIENIDVRVCKTCGNVLHSMEEIIAVCLRCGNEDGTLCAWCSQNNCQKCRMTLCSEHSYTNKRGEVFCKAHSPVHWFLSSLKDGKPTHHQE